MSRSADADELRTRTHRFLRNWNIDQPFYTAQFAAEVGLYQAAAEALLEQLARRQEVHVAQDGWQPGPPPPAPTYDQM